MSITRKEEELFQALKPVVEPLEVKLIDVELKTHGKRPAVRVIIGSDEGVDADLCERVSRNVSPVLDLEDPGFSGAYDLQVSSPGLDRRLRRPEEYGLFSGEKIEVTCYAPYQEQKQWLGTIVSFESDELKLRTDEAGTVSIPEEMIASARLHFDAEAALKSEGDQKNE